MRSIVAIILLILILSLGIYEQVYFKSIFSKLEAQTQEIIEAIEDENFEQAIKLIDLSISWWNKQLEILELTINHSILGTISVQQADIKGQLEGEDASQSIGACYVLIGSCENASHLLGFSLQHIF